MVEFDFPSYLSHVVGDGRWCWQINSGSEKMEESVWMPSCDLRKVKRDLLLHILLAGTSRNQLEKT